MAASCSPPAISLGGMGGQRRQAGLQVGPQGAPPVLTGEGCTRSSEPPARLLCPRHVTDQETSQLSGGWAGGPISSTSPQSHVQSLLCVPAVSTTASSPGAPTTHYLPKTPDFLLRKALPLCVTIPAPGSRGGGRRATGMVHDPGHSPDPLLWPWPPAAGPRIRPGPPHQAGNPPQRHFFPTWPKCL